VSLHQYRMIRNCDPMPGIHEHIPKLLPFMEKHVKPTWVMQRQPHLYRYTWDPMFGHELAHVMEIFERGQVHRLKQENLGWPMGNFGTFTAKAASTECKVFAMQWLLEEMLTGKIDGSDILGFEAVALFMNSPRFWSKKDEFHGWASERSPAHRLQDAVREYKSRVKDLLGATVDYMVDECAEFL
jgi:hypothetical protein